MSVTPAIVLPGSACTGSLLVRVSGAMLRCPDCGAEWADDDKTPECCPDVVEAFARFAALVDAKRDEMFWAIVGETP